MTLQPARQCRDSRRRLRQIGLDLPRGLQHHLAAGGQPEPSPARRTFQQRTTDLILQVPDLAVNCRGGKVQRPGRSGQRPQLGHRDQAAQLLQGQSGNIHD